MALKTTIAIETKTSVAEIILSSVKPELVQQKIKKTKINFKKKKNGFTVRIEGQNLNAVNASTSIVLNLLSLAFRVYAINTGGRKIGGRKTGNS